jgi:hypothetical protein
MMKHSKTLAERIVAARRLLNATAEAAERNWWELHL